MLRATQAVAWRVVAGMPPLSLKLVSPFTAQLPPDPLRENTRRQVRGACYSYVRPRVPSAPRLVHASAKTAQLIGLPAATLDTEAFVRAFSGAELPAGAEPYAMNYGGHQFGHWAGQLGDGRAINLGQVRQADGGQLWAVQLKGAGATPYSRRADGLAVLRSSIREHLCSEAMHHLGVPTSRSLSVMLTGDEVLRDVLYDGNAAYELGAVVCRVARSFVRFGSFEIHAASGDVATLRALADYTLRQHFPDVEAGTAAGVGEFYRKVCERSLAMVLEWQRVGFVHGVMNTDNMSILGDTIDYGPYGWLEGYDPDWTPNTTDRQQRRYRYGQQPNVVLWNLHKLANALYPLVEDERPFVDALDAFRAAYAEDDYAMHRAKLGLAAPGVDDAELIAELLAVLTRTETDTTIFFRLLAEVDAQTAQPLEVLHPAFYAPAELTGDTLAAWQAWLQRYRQRLALEPRTAPERRAAMNAVNPKYVLRNYMAQLAIDAAELGDFSIVDELYRLLERPYDEQPAAEDKWFVKRPEWARNRVGCSMLSCSS